MADYFVASGGSNTAPYDTWAKAATSLATALAAATADGDRVILQYNGIPSGDAELSVDTSYTIAANVSIIASTNSGTSTVTPTAMGTANWIGNSTVNRGVTLSGANRAAYVYGVTLRTAGSSADDLSIGSSSNDGLHIELDSCYLWNGNTATSSRLNIGSSGSGSNNGYAKLKNCTLRLGSTSQVIILRSNVDMVDCLLTSDGSAPSILFRSDAANPSGAYFNAIGCDFSHAGSGTLLGNCTAIALKAEMINCKLGTSFTALGTQTNVNKAGGTIALYNCSSTDQHYHFEYHDSFGSQVAETGIYANDGALYDGTNHLTWKIFTTANCTYYTPFVSQWIEKYHSGTSAITPYIEILRDGSTTPYQDDEVWAEFAAQATTTSTRSTFKNDAMTLAGTAADQTAGVGLSGWTGEGGTAWSGKLVAPSSFTPAEIGFLMARIIVGQPSITVYADPTIRT